MAKKNFWLVMLVSALVFGLAVVGCDDTPEEGDTNPSPPTGLAGTVVSPNNSIQLTWNSVSNADEYWIEYKKNSSSVYQNKSGIKTTSYTFTDLDYATKYDFRVAVRNTDYYTSSYSSPISVTTGNPLIANVSLSMETTCFRWTDSILGSTTYYYSAVVKLTLPDGSWWNASNITQDLFKSWVTMSGTPNVSTWNVTLYDYSTTQPQTVQFSYGYTSNADDVSISGLTATIATSKTTEMKTYTNVVNSLTTGSPSSASSSSWTKTGSW